VGEVVNFPGFNPRPCPSQDVFAVHKILLQVWDNADDVGNGDREHLIDQPLFDRRFKRIAAGRWNSEAVEYATVQLRRIAELLRMRPDKSVNGLYADKAEALISTMRRRQAA
jgi:hypothetical protein